MMDDDRDMTYDNMMAAYEKLRAENARLQLLVDEARTLSPEAFMALEAERDALRAALDAIRQQCEALPDRVDPAQTRLWTETVNAIYALAEGAANARRGANSHERRRFHDC